MTTPEELKKIRINLNLDQNQFADKLGYSRQFISDLERGVKPITEKTEIKLKNISGQQETASEDEAVKCFLWFKKEFNLSDDESRALLDDLASDKLPYTLLSRIRTGDKQAVKLLKFIFPVLNDD